MESQEFWEFRPAQTVQMPKASNAEQKYNKITDIVLDEVLKNWH